MNKIPEDIKSIAQKYNLSLPKSKRDFADFWSIGTKWIISHDAVMKIADKEGIIFYQPNVEVLKDEGRFYGVAMWGNGRIDVPQEDGGKKSKMVWTSADATRDNVKGRGGYYFNMAEKRWQDRLTLKLLNLYEYGLYSDVEAEEFKKGAYSEKPISDYMKNTIRQLLVAKGEYKKDVVEKTIFPKINAEDGKEWRDKFQGGRIDKTIVEFYKLAEESNNE